MESQQYPEIQKSLRVFAVTGVIWYAAAALAIGLVFAPSVRALIWFSVIWGLCQMDLLAIGKLMARVMSLMSDSKKRNEDAIQAFAWGSLKLACLGLLGVIMMVGRDVPTSSLLLGLATLIVVPLAGGLWWYQRVLRHA